MREIVNARITDVRLGYEDHGILTAFVFLDYGGSGQGFGGYALDAYRDGKRAPSAACGAFIAGVLKVLEVEEWEKLPGQIVRVDREHHQIYRLGHALKDQWFDPKIELQKIKE